MRKLYLSILFLLGTACGSSNPSTQPDTDSPAAPSSASQPEATENSATTLPEALPSISYAWIRTAPPNSGVNAGYMRLHNSGQALRIVDARSLRFDRIEFHHMNMDGGQMLMRQLAHVAVAAKSEHSLQPSGDHLMLYRAEPPLTRGERIPMTLTVEFESGRQALLEVEFLVRDRAPQYDD